MPNGFWTAERVDHLQQLTKRWWSARQIAQELGTTRNAIIGKTYRIGLQLGPLDQRTPDERRAHRLEWQRNYQRQRKLRLGFIPRRHIAQPIAPLPSNAPVPLQLSVLELKLSTCCWPITQRPPHLFCGHPTTGGKQPYCAWHQWMGHNETH